MQSSYYNHGMTGNHLTLRLSSQDALLIEHLRVQTGLSKSDVVKHALRTLASNEDFAAPAAQGLFALGEGSFGRHGDASRQSADIKSVVGARLMLKRKTNRKA
jgi:hypothetical protein